MDNAASDYGMVGAVEADSAVAAEGQPAIENLHRVATVRVYAIMSSILQGTIAYHYVFTLPCMNLIGAIVPYPESGQCYIGSTTEIYPVLMRGPPPFVACALLVFIPLAVDLEISNGDVRSRFFIRHHIAVSGPDGVVLHGYHRRIA